MKTRHNYLLTLPVSAAALHTQHPPGGTLRNPTIEETEALAELMLDAYLKTIDYEGENTDDALEEINGYFAHDPLLACSWVYASGDMILAASLMSMYKGAPLIAYIITRATWKERGLGAYVVRQSLLSLQDSGYSEVRATVTEGNTPSEKIMARFGFVRESAAV